MLIKILKKILFYNKDEEIYTFLASGEIHIFITFMKILNYIFIKQYFGLIEMQ